MKISEDLLMLESILNNEQAVDNLTVAQHKVLTDTIEQQFMREAEAQFKTKVGESFYYCYQFEEGSKWKFARVTVTDFTLSMDDHIIIHLRNHTVGIHVRTTLENYRKLAIVPNATAAKHYCEARNRELEETAPKYEGAWCVYFDWCLKHFGKNN